MPRAAAKRRPGWHPLLLAGFILVVARGTGLLLHFLSRDPNGNPVSASPLQSLVVTVPYHGAFVLSLIAALLGLWLLAPPLRRLVTPLGVALCLAAVLVGQVDLGLQWFIGQRLSPDVLATYGGSAFLNSDVYAPLLHHRGYFGVGMLLMFGPWALLAWNAARVRGGAPEHRPNWWMVAALGALALLCRVPLGLAHGHQRDVARPPELLWVHHWRGGWRTPPVTDEALAVSELRAVVDPRGTAEWQDPRYPLVREAPPERNRYLKETGLERVEPLPDILLLCVESLRGADLGFIPGNLAPGEESPTPRLDALARHGVVLARHISNGNPSPRGFIALNAGVWDHRKSFIISGSTGTHFDALPQRLRARGYRTLGLWGADPTFDNQIFWANKWFDGIRHARPVGRLYIMRALADDVIMDMLLDDVAGHDREHPGQPLFAYVATAGTHEPYRLQGETKLAPELVATVNAEPDDRRRYRMVLANLDAQIGRVVDALAQRPTGRPWLMIVVGDHSDVAGERVPPEMNDMPHDPSEWTGALIIGPPSLVGPPRVETFPSSHVDLMPTLLDLVGDRDPVVGMGTNLFADVPPGERTAVSVSGRGYRLDQGGWSLFVMRDHADGVWTLPIGAPLAELRSGVDGSPFTQEDVRRLRLAFDTWSWLIEENRVWPAHPR